MNPVHKSSLENKPCETKSGLLQLKEDLSFLDLDNLQVELLEERLNLSGAGCVIDTNGNPVYKF
ncbi:hypothetical protein [Candidatus Leptofilum sp.]|uniref:hypothetical protein n=1 Tax=Candidatus Leptofilum sp. TaxID=3241576 RepID=UPI003B5C3714